MRKNIIKSVSGLNVHNLSVEDVREVMDWKELSGLIEPTVNKNGLWAMVELAISRFSVVAKSHFGERYGYLPWNLAGHGPWANLPRWRNFRQSESLPQGYHVEEKGRFANCGDLLSYAARFYGWLTVAGSLRGVVKSIAANTGSGMGSPYTTVNPYKLFEHWPSPDRLERQIWKARDRADQILAPYGLKVSWSALGQAMVKHGVVGKAALWAAEETVRVYLLYYDRRFEHYRKEEAKQERFYYLCLARGLSEMKNFSDTVQRWAVSQCLDGEFSSLREALGASGRLVSDVTDGVELLVDPSIGVIHGVEVRAGWLESQGSFGQNGRLYLLKQIHTGRTYHASGHLTPRDAVKYAIGAWRRQAELERREANLVSFLRGDRGYCPLVYRRQSYDAGNCERGTYAWLSSKGWAEKSFMPGEWLIPYLGESRVRNTAMALYRCFTEN